MGIPFTLPMGFLFTVTMGILLTIALGIQLTISIRRGEPTGLVPRGPGAADGLSAAYTLSLYLLR